MQKTLEQRRPFDKTNVAWTQAQLNLLAKGQKFIPTPKKVDRVQKFKDFLSFARKLRLAVFFHRRSQEGGGGEISEGTKCPWTKASEFGPVPGENMDLEEFLTEVMGYIFDPKNMGKRVDNLTAEEREALRDLSKWNKDPNNPRLIRIQDKGSCFVVDFKDSYEQKVNEYVGDPSTFRSDEEDLSLEHENRVKKWVKKWEDKGWISEECSNWVEVDNPKPANLYANVKTHKENWPYRFIMSSRGTATEILAKWLEYQLKPFAKIHDAYIKDTKSFLLYLEHLNSTRAHFREGTKLISWDVKDFYPNCNTEKCIEAVKKVLETNANMYSLDGSLIEYIQEALAITMSSNNGTFNGKFFTQINGATIGGPESASTTDIFGAIHIDTIAREGDGSLIPQDWKRYRDDTFDINTNCTREMIENFTRYLNKTVLPGKVKFEPEYSEKYLDFLDVRVHLRGGYLIPEIHSKPTDSHEYLNPLSSHPPQVAKNNPYSVALRVRRNCSDRIEQDQFFVDNLIKYKAYLLHSGYDSEMVDKQFVKVAKMKRKETLKTRTKPKLNRRKYNFVTTWDPAFPDIRKALHKFTNVLMEDEECREDHSGWPIKRVIRT